MAPSTGRPFGQGMVPESSGDPTPAARLASEAGLPVPLGKSLRTAGRPTGAERIEAIRLRVAARAAAADSSALTPTASGSAGLGLAPPSSSSPAPTANLGGLPARVGFRPGGPPNLMSVGPGGQARGRDDPLVHAIERMSGVFGACWRERFHHSHQLSLAAPLVYCRVCGHHCGSSQHLVELGSKCSGPPDPALRGNVGRLRRLSSGWSPQTGGPRLERAVPLPAGTKGVERPASRSSAMSPGQ